MMELVGEETYNISHKAGPVFTLRHLTRGVQDEIQRRCIIPDGKGGATYDTSLEQDIKIEKCLVGWTGITSGGEAVPCDSESKKRLPVGVTLWLIQKIDEDAGLRMPEEEKKN